MPYIAVHSARGGIKSGSKHVALGATEAVGDLGPEQVYICFLLFPSFPLEGFRLSCFLFSGIIFARGSRVCEKRETAPVSLD